MSFLFQMERNDLEESVLEAPFSVLLNSTTGGPFPKTSPETPITVYDYLDLILFTLRGFVAFVGFFANLLVIFCVVYFQKLRQINNFFVANLAILDALILFLVGVFFMPKSQPKILKIAHENDNSSSSDKFCIPGKIANTVTFTSLVALILISVDRFVFIIMPMRYQKIERNWIKITAISMLVSLFYFGIQSTFLMCEGGIKETVYNIMNLIASVVWFVTSAILYSLIFKTAFQQNRAVQHSIKLAQRASLNGHNSIGLQNSNSNSTNEQRPVLNNTQKRIVIGYSLIVGFALITFLVMDALEITYIINPNIGLSDQKNLLIQLAKLQMTLNSAVNPFIYAATQKVYRDAFISVLSCRVAKNGCRAIEFGNAERTDRIRIDVA